MEPFSSSPLLKSYFIGVLALLLSHTAVAQKDTINRHPTQAQIDEKMAILERSKWETPFGKMDSLSRIMVTGPEQNCSNAIPVCQQTYTQSTSYTGVGTIDEVKNCCLKSGEKNSVWYVFTTQTAGNFGFTINTVKDYDFAIYDITTMGCEGIPTATPNVCNYSSTPGQTGMIAGGLASNSEPASGLPFCGLLAVAAGKTYVLIVSNFTGDATGYSLTFTTGSGYTSITDGVAPTINPPNSVINNCDNTLTVNLSEPVKCSTIASNGSDFTISGSGTITAASGVGCSTNAYVSQVLVTYTAPATGTYTLGIKNGSDGNTIMDKCGNSMATTQTITFNHLALALSASPTSVCTSGSAVTLTATGANAGGTYTLTPGGTSNTTGIFTVNPNVTTIYVVTVTYGGCTKTATTTVSVLSNVVASIYPINPTICSGTTTLTASAIVNGTNCPTCTFSWAPGGATTQAITVGSGTYTVTVVKPGSTCNATASSTVNLASAGSGTTCNIYYVSPTGTGSGFLPSDPTSIDAALDAANCVGAIIKMQTGIYNLSDKLIITSYTTMEGGYNSTFTIKTSDIGSGNATTLVRDETPDGGTGTSVTTIEAAASTVGFRIQDIRIEMPDEVAGAQLTNYGIKLGASCSGYKINRCYIDAGVGSD